MLEFATKLAEITSKKTRADLERDEILALAAVRLIEIIGEAATHVPLDTRAKESGIPWRQITGARNRLMHAYFDVDLDLVWSIIADDLGPLIDGLRSLISRHEIRPSDGS